MNEPTLNRGHLEVGIWPAEIDGAEVIQIDTNGHSGRLRVNINDAPVYDANPETNEGEMPCLYNPNFTSRSQEIDELLEQCQEAANAALGDSNDTEIEALQGALETALGMLNLEMPQPKDQDQ